MSITDTALRRANLSEAKRSLLEKHLKRKAPAQAAPPREMIPRRSVHSPAPLSLMQQRLWFLTRLKGSPAYYNTAKAFVLEGALDVGALEKALGELLRRHESLRTTFDVVGGEPMQIINPPRPVRLPVLGLDYVPPAEREAEAIRLANEEAHRPFDLAAEPLCRFRVLRLNEREHVVLFTIHQLVTDRVSMAVFTRELAILYPAFCEGREVTLPELPIQYADFAAWQREWLRGEVLERQLAFWKKQLTGAPPVLDLPTDRPRPAMRSFRGAKETLVLSRELSDALRRLSHAEGVTVFMTLLASLQTLLLRYTGQEDMLTGSPIAGRNRLETEGLIGPFVNILGMRVDLSGNPTFRELLRRVREVALGAYAHQDMPFEKLVDELQLELDPSSPPLFQAVLSVTPGNSLKLQNLHLRPLPIVADTAKFDLLLRLTDAEPGLAGALEYNGDLFDRETVVRLLASFRTLLESVVADPERRLLDLPLLTEEERRRLLVEWNDTATPFDKELCVHDLLARWAERTPDAVAAVFDKTDLTYAELNRRANRLAHHLNALGVGPESRVGICMPGSPELLIGLLAILKAGAGYVWIDPQHSPGHVSFLLQDAHAKVLLTLETLTKGLTHTAPKIVCVDAEADAVARQSEENPRRTALPQNPACVVYTGGHAGQPKGVELTHEGLVNLVQWQQRELALRPASRFVLLEGVSANASRWELWVALAGGATLVWPSDDVARSRPVEIHDWIVAEEIELCFAPTRLTETLCSLPWPDETRLRVLVTEGERLYRQPARPLPFSLLHLGTAFESTVVMASGRLAAGEIERRARPAARPIANKKLYLLSEDLQPVPVGAVGELYVGGSGQARGYLNGPALTAEKFIPDPFGTEPGGRLYRTGLSARYLADGGVELRGRTDEKLTLNGFPVDPREVEAALLRHQAVEEVFVTSYVGRQTQKKRLAVYITTQADSIEELPSFLRRQLPQYMLPQKMVAVRSLPRTPTGEIDHSALPAPEPQGFEASGNFIQPRDWLEYRLSLIWGEVLGVEPVGIEDNFFELGGHSLLALCLLARIRHLLGTELPLTTLLQYPTIAGLTALLREQRVASSDSPLVKLQSAGHAAPFFCVHPAGGSALSYAELAQHLGTDRPFYGLQAAGWGGEQSPEARVEELAAQYLEAVRTVQPAGPYLLGGWSAGGIIAFEMARQLEERGERVALLALLDSQLPRRREAGHEDADLIFSFAQNIGLGREHFHPAEAGLGQLSEDEQVRHVFERARGAGILASDAELPTVRHLFRVFKANVRATESYVPRTYSGKITLFYAGERAAGSEADPLLGWGGLAAQGVESRPVPGTHRSMFRAPHVQALAEELKACTDAADRM